MPTRFNFFFEDSSFNCLEFSGLDAKDFLQRMTTANVKNLSDDHKSSGCLLTATGKLLQFFSIYQCEKERLLLFCAGAAETSFQCFEKFHFRENFEIKKAEELKLFRFALSSKEQKDTSFLPALTYNSQFLPFQKVNKSMLSTNLHFFNSPWSRSFFQDTYVFDLVLHEEDRAYFFDFFKKLNAKKLNESEIDWNCFFGQQRIHSEISESYLPLEVALDFAVHENKGCYPGQEVIERIRSMGQSPRKLASFRAAGAIPKPLTKIFLKENPTMQVGEITSAAQNPIDPSYWTGLGTLKKMAAKPGISLLIEGQSVDYSLVSASVG